MTCNPDGGIDLWFNLVCIQADHDTTFLSPGCAFNFMFKPDSESGAIGCSAMLRAILNAIRVGGKFIHALPR